MNGGMGLLDSPSDNTRARQPALFLVVLGGRSEGCLIEHHDVRLVVGTCRRMAVVSASDA